MLGWTILEILVKTVLAVAGTIAQLFWRMTWLGSFSGRKVRWEVLKV